MSSYPVSADGRIPGPVYPYFNLTKAEAVSSLATWLQSPRFKLTCRTARGDTYTWGPETPELCVRGIDVTLMSSQFGNKTIEFDPGRLEASKVVDFEDPSVYVIPFPLYEYALPNAMYDGAWYEFKPPEGSGETSLSFLEQPKTIFNPFNATSASLREYHGVPQDILGSDRVSQGSTMFIGAQLSAVNASAVNEYVDLLGLERRPLLMPAWAPPNNLSLSLEKESTTNEMLETMLDTQSQVTFAPLAATYFVPNEQPLGELRAALVDAGLNENQVSKTLKAFEAINPTKDVLDSLDGLDKVEKNVTGEFFGRYLAAFGENVTATGAPQVLSLRYGPCSFDLIHPIDSLLDNVWLVACNQS
jgi:hypothetical protein